MNIFFRLRPADAVTLSFIGFLLAIVISFFQSIPNALLLTAVYLLLITAQIILMKFKDRNRLLGISHDLLFPVICVLVLFDSLGSIVHSMNPEDIDPLLAKLDYLLFGVHPTVALEKIMNPVLTDILQLAYTSYYFLPLILGIALIKNKKRREFEESLFLILLCFYLSYAGYILFPALGPRFYLDHLQTTQLQGFLIAEPMQKFLNYAEGIKRDAFPSGHTAIALTVLYLSFKFSRKIFWFFLPVVSALIFSTVYCRYHYVVDVIAGIILAIITILSGEWYYQRWQNKNSKALQRSL